MRSAKGIVVALTIVLLSALPGRTGAAQQRNSESEQELQKAKSLMARRQYDKAIEELKRAKKLRQNECAACDFLLGEAYEGVRAYKNAAESADAALKHAPDDKLFIAEVHNLKGLASLGLAKPEDKKDKHLKEAEAEFRAALALTSALPVARHNLGIALLRQERDAEGLAELQAYVKNPAIGADLEEVRKMIADPRRARVPFSPNFSFTTLEGEYIASGDLHGKVVMLDFWGTWCRPCVESVPTIADLYKKYSKKPFQLIGISSDSDDAAWRTFVAKHKMTWPEYRDDSDRVLRAFDIRSFPTYIVVDHEGIIRYRSSGYGSETYVELARAIDGAIKKLGRSAKEHPGEPTGTTTSGAAPPGAPNSNHETVAESPASVPPTSAPPASTAGLGASSDTFPETARGTFDDDTDIYRNNFFGFSLRVPEEWQIMDEAPLKAREKQLEEAQSKAEEQLRQSLESAPGRSQEPQRVVIAKSVRHLLFHAALPQASNDRVASTLSIWAQQPLRGMPPLADYFRAQRLVSGGIDTVGVATPISLAGKTFMRADHKISSGGHIIWNSEIVSFDKGWLWGVTVNAPSEEILNQITGLLPSLVSVAPSSN